MNQNGKPNGRLMVLTRLILMILLGRNITVLSMLPGITGAGIHIGHGRTFQFADIKARFAASAGL
ncbi:hypothetical protein [Candidatus Minimicrobia naudis]